MFEVIDVRCDRCSIWSMFDMVDVQSSVCLVYEEAQDTCKGGRSSDFLNEVVD